MAVLSLYCFNSFLRYPPPQIPDQVSSFYGIALWNDCNIKRGIRNRRKRSNSRFVVLSTHSNPKIFKANKKLPYGRDDEEYEEEEEEEEEELDDDQDDFPRDDWLFFDDFAETSEYDVNGKRFKLKKAQNRQGSRRRHEKHQGSNTLKSRKGLIKSENVNNFPKKTSVGNYPTSEETNEVSSLSINGRGKLAPRTSTGKENRYERLSDEIVLDKKWIPLLDYLSTFGLKESHFMQMYERHMTSLQTNVCSARERLEYLLSVGAKQRDIRRILLRQPQILQYTVENNLKSHVAFLKGLGIPNSRVGQIIAAAPSLFSYSVENSLKPTVRYLIEEVGIKEKDLGKVVQLSPQILVQRIDISWNTRYLFLSEQLGAPRDSVVKMVTKHPQLLHYSIDDGLLPRINFLRSIGMHNSDILKVLTSLTQVLSLSLEENLKPKYMYLINELNNEVHSLTKYPMYLSLSLDQRIRPRHLFLVALKKVPKGPFPLSSLVPTDECFCQQWAGTNVDKYLAFRQGLLLKEFAKKYKKQG